MLSTPVKSVPVSTVISSPSVAAPQSEPHTNLQRESPSSARRSLKFQPSLAMPCELANDEPAGVNIATDGNTGMVNESTTSSALLPTPPDQLVLSTSGVLKLQRNPKQVCCARSATSTAVLLTLGAHAQQGLQ